MTRPLPSKKITRPKPAENKIDREKTPLQKIDREKMPLKKGESKEKRFLSILFEKESGKFAKS